MQLTRVFDTDNFGRCFTPTRLRGSRTCLIYSSSDLAWLGQVNASSLACPSVVIAGLHEKTGVAMMLNVPHDRENQLSLDTQLLQSFQIGNQVGIAGHRIPEFKIQC